MKSSSEMLHNYWFWILDLSKLLWLLKLWNFDQFAKSDGQFHTKTYFTMFLNQNDPLCWSNKAILCYLFIEHQPWNLEEWAALLLLWFMKRIDQMLLWCHAFNLENRKRQKQNRIVGVGSQLLLTYFILWQTESFMIWPWSPLTIQSGYGSISSILISLAPVNN